MDIELNDVKLMFGDCLERMKEIPEGSVDLIITDPPFGTMSNIAQGDDTKHGLKGRTEWDVALNTKQMMKECHRVLRNRGTLILFSQGDYTVELTSNNHGNLPLDYRMIWVKEHFGNGLIAKRAPVNFFEDINVYSKVEENQKDHPLQEWFNFELSSAGLTVKEIINLLGNGGVRHHFTSGKVFRIPTQERYEQLQLATGQFQMLYSDVTEIDKLHRDDQVKYSKTFNLPDDVKFKSNVLTYPKDLNNIHPTQKPVALLEDLIVTFSNVGDSVLDFTMGSGSAGIACINTGRKFTGVELDPTFYGESCNHILTHLS